MTTGSVLVLDVNVQVFAFAADSTYHAEYADWLGESLAGHEPIGLLDASLSGFVRVVTDRRIFAEPATTSSALDFVEALISAPATMWLPASDATWAAVRQFAAVDSAIVGNLVPDAYLAAATVTHGGRLATADRVFARYPGLRWFDPVARG